MTRSLLIIASATLVALGLPVSGMTRVGASAGSTVSRTIEKALVRSNQAGSLAETAVAHKKENAALSEAWQMVRDLGRVKALWPHQRDAVTPGMLHDLTITMNTVLGLKGEIQAVGWPGTGSLERSLTATWNMGAQLLSLSSGKSLGTAASSIVLPPPIVTTVTTMPSSAVAGTAWSASTSSTSVGAASTRGDTKHDTRADKKGHGDSHAQPGHHRSKHKKNHGDKHHGH